MTGHSAVIRPVRVLDAMCLIHFGRADRLDVLRDLLVDKDSDCLAREQSSRPTRASTDSCRAPFQG
jgi:hypothetical protein